MALKRSRILRTRHEDLEAALNRSALWAITYGDMMSYLMIFFLILFSFGLTKVKGGAADKRKYEQSLVSIQKVFGGHGSSPDYERAVKREREETMVTQVKEALDKSQLSEFAKIETTDKKVRLVLAEGVLFDSGKAKIKPGALRVLGAVGNELKAMPNPIVIEGHTDNVPVRRGRYGSNWELSMARAYAVLRYFQDQGIEPARLAGIGYGEHKPVAGNGDREGRAKNRRIEIDLIRTE